MSDPVPHKPYRLVDWCVEHDSQQDLLVNERCQWALTMALDLQPELEPCRFYKMELRPHGYETIEWGEQ